MWNNFKAVMKSKLNAVMYTQNAHLLLCCYANRGLCKRQRLYKTVSVFVQNALSTPIIGYWPIFYNNSLFNFSENYTYYSSHI